MIGGLEDYVALHRNLVRVEKWADKDLMSYRKGKCKVLYLGLSVTPRYL